MGRVCIAPLALALTICANYAQARGPQTAPVDPAAAAVPIQRPAPSRPGTDPTASAPPVQPVQPVQPGASAPPAPPPPASVPPAKAADSTAVAAASPTASVPSASAPQPKRAATSDLKPESTADAKPSRPRFPRLVVAGGPFIGPHALGNEECRAEARTCEKRGTFFGLGLQAEVRLRVYKPVYIHGRGLIARNVSPSDRVYRGIGGGSVGLGAYGRRAFARAEFMLLAAYGDNRFTPPFHAAPTGRDTWGNTAGLISAGVRQPFAHRLGVELWGGLMVGPSSVRTVPSAQPDRRILTTFMLGLNIAVDAWQ